MNRFDGNRVVTHIETRISQISREVKLNKNLVLSGSHLVWCSSNRLTLASRTRQTTIANIMHERSAQRVLGVDECAAQGKTFEELVEHQCCGEGPDGAGARRDAHSDADKNTAV